MRVSYSQIIRYAIAHPDVIVPELGRPLRVILTTSAIERMGRTNSLLTRFNGLFSGGNALNSALTHNRAIRELMDLQFIDLDILRELIRRFS